MAEKKTQLSIVLRAVDRATRPIAAIHARVNALTGPLRQIRERLSGLGRDAGLPALVDGFKGVGSAITGILTKIGLIGGAIAAATAGVFKLVDEFDSLGDKAEAIGVSVDFLAQMRFVAEKTGASVEEMDTALQGFSKNIGLARANTGPLVKFLSKVSPALLKQLKATKSNEEAVDLFANAMAKLPDSARRAALAQKVLGNAALAPTFAKGSHEIGKLRSEFGALAGSQKEAADEAGKVDDAMKDFKAAVQGVKAALVVGLAPALKEIVERLRAWFQGNRENIKEWAVSLGKKIPGAFNALVGAVKSAIAFVKPFVDSGTKLKIVAAAVAAVIAGPLIASIVSLTIALATNPIGLILTAIAALAVAWYVVITRWDEVKAYFAKFWNWLDSKIGIVKDILLIGLAPFIYVPGKIIQYWEPISGFFVGLWDAITGAFRAAWDFIKSIVDKVMGAVDKVAGAIDTVKSAVGLGDDYKGVTPVTDVVNNIVANLQQQQTAARIAVDFANAPRGTRVSADPGNTAAVDFNVGYNMSFAP